MQPEAYNFIKKVTPTQMFLKNTFIHVKTLVAASAFRQAVYVPFTYTLQRKVTTNNCFMKTHISIITQSIDT